MSVKLEAQLKQLKDSTDKRIASLKNEIRNAAASNKKTVEALVLSIDKLTANPKPVQNNESHDLKREIMKIVNQEYITDLYRNK
ncbi:hypothetical protein JLT2_25 [Paraglaciecola Antarctic JLT virus 2]|nr:hypothetical protein JLT2_25 [Paraglaciecola Antarctic JLT virus 2]